MYAHVTSKGFIQQSLHVLSVFLTLHWSKSLNEVTDDIQFRLKAGRCYNIWYLSITHLKLKSKSCSSRIFISVVRLFWKFAQSTALRVPCSVQNFIMIWQLRNTLWAKTFSCDLSEIKDAFWADVLFYPHILNTLRPGQNEPLMVKSLTHICVTRPRWVNTLSPRQNGRHFADRIWKCIFLNENVLILIKISLQFVPKGPINNIH